ncbi:MAG: heavy-metal-associated domain-containing protein, partial [Phycisphaerales bacterium]|nr:heavy-metal-associated domain-containing protein [Phycisphaerales bacterium]
VAAVTRALRESPGVRVAEVSLSEGQAVIHGTGLDPANLINTVRELGYEVDWP